MGFLEKNICTGKRIAVDSCLWSIVRETEREKADLWVLMKGLEYHLTT